ncbi:uncharacterized protein, PEP-CTERM system associated [Desulfacinum hydrothermale DSM 13146]|uniref:Uncharacterized protein, PEP-CTERM system associated n=1 Tax=Desulfacinum hydrothermale DSM 13146 TaxID=1121390 RepID=A0A1W1XR95_9BACT|nr:outer membrane beta-barrel protein [Desulfacinum hydrothermale]SMC26407.1 uncharacterized protein, PEP-CTERM system associated [Desulfacinum hydrothermale DSM 13146]
MGRWMLGLTLALFVCAVAPVSAQAGYRHQIIPNLSVSGEYTDNVNLTENDTDSDWILVVTPSLTYEVSGRRNGLRLSYAPGAALYAKNGDDNTLRHSLDFNAWHSLTKNTHLSFYDHFLRTEDPNTDEVERRETRFRSLGPAEEGETPPPVLSPEELGLQPDTTLREGRKPYITNTAAARLTHTFGRGHSLFLGYLHSLTEHESRLEEDSMRHNPTAGITYQINPHLSLAASGGYTRGTFDADPRYLDDPTEDFDRWNGSLRLNRAFSPRFSAYVDYSQILLDSEGDGDDYVVYHASVGGTYVLSPKSSLTVGVGYFFQDNQDEEDEKGLTLNLNYNTADQWKAGRLVGSFSVQSGFREAFFGTENLGFSSFYGATMNLRYAMTKKISWSSYLTYRRDDYLNETPERKDNAYLAGVGVQYQISRRFSLSLSFSHRTIDSNLDEEDSHENRVGVDFSMNLSPELKPISF